MELLTQSPTPIFVQPLVLHGINAWLFFTLLKGRKEERTELASAFTSVKLLFLQSRL